MLYPTPNNKNPLTRNIKTKNNTLECAVSLTEKTSKNEVLGQENFYQKKNETPDNF